MTVLYTHIWAVLIRIWSSCVVSCQQMTKQTAFQFWLTVSVMWSSRQSHCQFSFLYSVRIRSQNSKYRWLQVTKMPLWRKLQINNSFQTPTWWASQQQAKRQQTQAAAGSWEIPCQETRLQHPQGLASRSKQPQLRQKPKKLNSVWQLAR